MATSEGSQDAGLQTGLRNDEFPQSYIHDHDEGMRAGPGHCAMANSPELAPPRKVSGWIENDRSLYFLHEIGIL